MNRKNTPKLRFKEFEKADPWEQRKLGDLINETRDKTTVEDEDTLLSCAIDGMFLNSELFSHFRGSSNIGYLKVKKNDLILSAQNLHLGNCNVNLRFEHGIISPAYKVYELIECDPLFIQAWVKQDKTKDFFLKASTEGASVCRKNIVWEELYKQELPVPKIDEQIKIGAFFENIDNLITLHQRKYEKLKKVKNAYLDEMFPKNGERFPKRRFPGFTDPWEQRKLSELVDYSNGTGHEDYVLPEGKYELITLKSINSEGELVSSGKYVDEEFETLKQNTLIMMLSEQAKGMLGMTTVIPCNNRYVLNQRVAALTLHDKVSSKFLTKAINNKQSYFEQMGAGTKVQNISRGHVENCLIEIPKYDEQKQIGDFFDNLDNLITLHQRELDKLKKLKAAYLDAMFVGGK
ncbi:MAG: restriction endonuclease subunit S [Butyrivibrio sp.]|uniref:restriction endonuclease subunit S n=1 Tax=Butyrivibrio sp. TaxID=28121 RepID=UPI001B5EAE54|nr:restriction endonuclease subunit S [Butyrivibrio sp.]MBP3783572.1 restriction endonuclease subunit S [Butyrivibrio sp.]